MSKDNYDLNTQEELKAILNKGSEVKALEVFLQNHPHALTATDTSGFTPLHWAILLQKPNFMQLLIEKGANTNTPSENSFLPLEMALMLSNEAIIELLLNNNANVNGVIYKGRMTPLMLCKPELSFDLIKKMIDKGADIHTESNKAGTVLSRCLNDDASISSNAAKLLNLTNEKGEPIFNVNLLNNKHERVIDIIHNESSSVKKDAINLLRKHGSVEPKNLITRENFNIDISNERLDSYQPNKVNAPKLLDKLYNNFPLSENDMNKIIDDYKAQDFGDRRNTVYEKNALTIPQVIDKLINLGEVDDRLPIKWEFKEVLATSIHAINQYDDSKREDIKIEFLNCLSQLKMCHLGMLINILAVAQEVIPTDIINYDTKDVKFFESVLAEAQKQLSDDLGEYASAAFIKWFFANYARSTGSAEAYKPEAMTLYSQKIVGIFNEAFMKAIDNGNNELLESYHFQVGLEGKILLPLLKNIGAKFLGGSDNSNLGQWEELFISGMEVIAKELLNEALKHKDDLEKLHRDS